VNAHQKWAAQPDHHKPGTERNRSGSDLGETLDSTVHVNVTAAEEGVDSKVGVGLGNVDRRY
jgi:hypothetical protein